MATKTNITEETTTAPLTNEAAFTEIVRGLQVMNENICSLAPAKKKKKAKKAKAAVTPVVAQVADPVAAMALALNGTPGEQLLTMEKASCKARISQMTGWQYTGHLAIEAAPLAAAIGVGLIIGVAASGGFSRPVELEGLEAEGLRVAM